MLTTHPQDLSPTQSRIDLTGDPVGNQTAGHTEEWAAVCPVTMLVEGRGVCVKVNRNAVAIFRVVDRLFAIDNTDPFSGASVLSRGLVGVTLDDGRLVPYVASPLRKQRFCLKTGRCLDDDGRRVRAYEVAVAEGTVLVRSNAHPAITAVKPR